MDEATQRTIASKGGQSQGKENNPGNFATLAAILLASSLVSKLAADLRPDRLFHLQSFLLRRSTTSSSDSCTISDPLPVESIIVPSL